MARNPFKVGDYVLADDPFNGRAEGVVMVIDGRSMGLYAINGPTDHYLYYDCRTVRFPD
ncbi:hypothetical protein ACQCSX_22270 (plasmid) [Pseudarthrobacter sp. P1]|uniref:hypothetical protein n=1 Tax=Pseudarthrobacter sp. P1 TaxID=3418418 RepID=UPI003CF32936